MSHREVTGAFRRMISCGLLRVFRSVSLPGLGGYIATGYKFDPVVMNAKFPLEFFEARNAVRIAQSEGAEKYASASYQHARPSNVVVLETGIREATVGTPQAVKARYEIVDRGGYIPTGSKFDPVVMNAKLPLEFMPT